MKTLKRFKYAGRIAIICLLILLVGGAVTGCHPAEQPEPKEEDNWNVDLSLFRIIRSDVASKAVSQSAGLLRTTIMSACGVSNCDIATDYVGKDGSSERAEYEIIVGHTNIPEENAVYDTLGKGEYAICLRGTKLIIVGDSDESTEAAVEAFMKKYLNYDVDKYTNDPIGTDKVKVVDEIGKSGTKLLLGGRTVKEAKVVMDSDPIEPSIENFTPSGTARFNDVGLFVPNGTGTFTTKQRIEEGAYRIQATVDIEGETMPTAIQFFLNDTGKSINLSVTNNTVKVTRYDYERGGVNFEGDSRYFTIRADVFPEGNFMRYYVDDIFLGETIFTDNDYPVLENTALCIAVVNGSDVTVSDIYMESIPEEDVRSYNDPGTTPANDAIYPKSQNAPGKDIYVVRAAGLSDDELLTLLTLQGIVNRTTPRIFVDYRKYNNDPRYTNIENEQVYLDILKAKGRTCHDAKLKDLLILFADEYKGVIFGTPFSGGTNYEENIITTLAGVLDGVYMTEQMYKTIKDDIKKDILFRTAGRFIGAVDAYMWLWNTYGDQCSKTVLFHLPTGSDKEGHPAMICRDYAVMSRAFVFCTDGIKTLSDYDFYMSLFAQSAPNTAVIGQGGGCFSEFEMFFTCGAYAKYFTYAFSTPNLSLFNSLEVGTLKQSQAEPVSLTKDTVYVTFDLSEGDNISWDYHLWMMDYNDKANRAAVAKGYSICGALYYVAPAILEYYYQNATPNDCFFMDGGGISNLSSPDGFGAMYCEKDRKAILARMLELTDYVANKTDLHVMRALHNISDDMTARYSEECPNLHSLFSAYSATAYQLGGYGDDYKNSIYMVDNIVRVRNTVKCDWQRKDLDVQLKSYMKSAPSRDGIYFVRVFTYGNLVLNNLAYFQEMEALLKSTGANVVIVRPDTFAELYAEYSE